MPGATNIQAIPYPIGTEVVGKAPSEVFQPMAEALETRLNMRFTTTSARDAAIPSPTEGMECFTGASTTSTKWIYSNGGWRILVQDTRTWTPTLTNVTLGTGGSASGRFQIAGGIVHFSALITLGTSGALTGGFAMSLPVDRRTAIAQDPIGTAFLRDTSASANRVWTVYGNGASSTAILSPDGTFVTATTPWTWASSDTIAIRGTYEAA